MSAMHQMAAMIYGRKAKPMPKQVAKGKSKMHEMAMAGKKRAA